MAEMDSSYTFVGLPEEERANIAIRKLEQMEREFFEAQLGFAIRKAEIPNSETEQLAAFAEEKQSVLGAHKKRLKVAKDIWNEVRILAPGEVRDAGDGSKRKGSK